MAAIEFSRCFSPKKIYPFTHLIDPTISMVQRMTGRDIAPPARVRCMTHREISEGKRRGKGHGLYYEDTEEIAVDPHMPWQGIYLNFIHELIHHYAPELSDQEINDISVPAVYSSVTGEKLDPKSWRKWRGTNSEG